MGVEVPHEVAAFLNFLGVPYPDIDEDQVRELARQVRTYAQNVANTHEAATGAVNEMGSVYSGYSYEQLVAAWARMSTGNMAELDRGCRMVARALDIAAEVITAVKVAVLASLAALAASYVSIMAATMATGGASAALTLAVRGAAHRILSAMEDMLIGYIAAEVIGKAIEPLEETVERMINGAVYRKAADELGVPSSSPQELRIDPDEVLRYADLLDKYADDMLDHSKRFAENVAALDFGRPDGLGEAPATDPGGPSGPLPGAPGHDSRPQGAGVPPGAVPSPVSQVPTSGVGDGSSTPRHSGADRPSATAPTRDRPEQSDRPAAASENRPAAAQSAGRPGTGDLAADRAAVSPSPVAADGVTSPAGARGVTSPVGEGVSERGVSTGQHAPSVISPVGSENLVQQGNSASSAITAATAGSAPSSDTNSPGQQQGAPRGQGGPRAGQGAAQPSRGQSQPSTPWQRTGRTGSPKPGRRGPTRNVTNPAAEHKTGATPWSKGTRPAAAETTAPEPKVFAPEPADRKRVSADPSGPKVVAPETGTPRAAPDALEPKVIAPEATAPEVVPGTASPKVAPPEIVGPEVTGAEMVAPVSAGAEADERKVIGPEGDGAGGVAAEVEGETGRRRK
ncbi:hypothetical protein [Nocardia wallacei]|uniref:WXG100-like domain-containing protein n=1 Tax=Nocardia wallacei TaxID=480035 RepID=UPI002453B3E5|nr:hypothetical protein [Nocardia wallacei]